MSRRDIGAGGTLTGEGGVQRAAVLVFRVDICTYVIYGSFVVAVRLQSSPRAILSGLVSPG